MKIPEERLIQFLYRQKNHQETGKMIKDMWNARKSILKYKEESRKKVNSKNEMNSLMMSDPGPKRSIAILDRGRRGVSELKG